MDRQPRLSLAARACLSPLFLVVVLAGCGDAGALDAGSSDIATDAGAVADASFDAAPEDAATSESDAGPSVDGGLPDASISDAAGPRTPAELLARNHWEQVGIEDSGGPRMDTPPGNFFTFDGTHVRFGCSDPSGLPYTISGGVVLVELSSSRLNWRIVTLTETEFSFTEGPDVFHFVNRQECLMDTP